MGQVAFIACRIRVLTRQQSSMSSFLRAGGGKKKVAEDLEPSLRAGQSGEDGSLRRLQPSRRERLPRVNMSQVIAALARRPCDLPQEFCAEIPINDEQRCGREGGKEGGRRDDKEVEQHNKDIQEDKEYNHQVDESQGARKCDMERIEQVNQERAKDDQPEGSSEILTPGALKRRLAVEAVSEDSAKELPCMPQEVITAEELECIVQVEKLLKSGSASCQKSLRKHKRQRTILLEKNPSSPRGGGEELKPRSVSPNRSQRGVFLQSLWHKRMQAIQAETFSLFGSHDCKRKVSIGKNEKLVVFVGCRSLMHAGTSTSWAPNSRATSIHESQEGERKLDVFFLKQLQEQLQTELHRISDVVFSLPSCHLLLSTFTVTGTCAAVLQFAMVNFPFIEQETLVRLDGPVDLESHLENRMSCALRVTLRVGSGPDLSAAFEKYSSKGCAREQRETLNLSEGETRANKCYIEQKLLADVKEAKMEKAQSGQSDLTAPQSFAPRERAGQLQHQLDRKAPSHQDPPRLSQIDPEIMKELPLEIRAELLLHLKRSSRNTAQDKKYDQHKKPTNLKVNNRGKKQTKGKNTDLHPLPPRSREVLSLPLLFAICLFLSRRSGRRICAPRAVEGHGGEDFAAFARIAHLHFLQAQWVRENVRESFAISSEPRKRAREQESLGHEEQEQERRSSERCLQLACGETDVLRRAVSGWMSKIESAHPILLTSLASVLRAAISEGQSLVSDLHGGVLKLDDA
eukprot:768429-Hanusia_phi.AAC.8